MNQNSNVVGLRHPDEIDDPPTIILQSVARQLRGCSHRLSNWKSRHFLPR
jgi:hypothetical protein